MKFLIIGLGSMGKRRIRCLQALGYKNISGFDISEDRINEAKQKYSIPVYNVFQDAIDNSKPDALIISVPPDHHMTYINYAIARDIHFFVEASVVDNGMQDAVENLKGKVIIAAPSATMMFHPAIQLIHSIVRNKELGKISNILLHSGQFLPDWHTYEKVGDYYVSNPPTGGGREIVPFELTWLTMMFGFPKRVAANFRKTIEIEGAEYIDDTYNCLLDYGTFLSVVTVDVVSRYATRRLVINGSKAQLYWSWDENCVKIFSPQLNAWESRNYTMKQAQTGYNANIGENMYIDEIRNFVDAIEGKCKFINSLENDHKVLKLLYSMEYSDLKARFIETK